MSNESEELFAYLSEIAERSFAGNIPWSQPNPSTFQWMRESEGEPYLVVIQKASNPRMKHSSGFLRNPLEDENTYLFQVQNRKSRQTVMALSSSDRPEFNKVLAEIFKGAEKGIDVRSSQVLKKLLGRE
jgi:hypothetical protein